MYYGYDHDDDDEHDDGNDDGSYSEIIIELYVVTHCEWYLISWIGRVHNTAKFFAGINHDPYHCACSFTYIDGGNYNKRQDVKNKFPLQYNETAH